MFAGFDFGILWLNAPFLWNGMLLTLQLTLLAVGGGLLLGVVLAVIRLSSVKPLAWLVEGYVNFLRSMPLILVIFWFYTLVPKLIGRPVSGFYSVLIAFVMFEAAYYSEIIRAGISSVRRNQISAALANAVRLIQLRVQTLTTILSEIPGKADAEAALADLSERMRGVGKSLGRVEAALLAAGTSTYALSTAAAKVLGPYPGCRSAHCCGAAWRCREI